MNKRKEFLISCLQDRDEQTRKLAAEALEKIETRARLDILAQKIENGEMLEKIRAVYALVDLKGPRVEDLVKKACKDPSEDVRSAAVRVLGAIGQNTLAILVELLKDQSPMVVRTAVEALNRYKDPRLLGPLMQMLKHQDPGVVERAIEGIGKIGDKRSEDAMLYFAQKGNPKMKGLALKALGEMDV